MNGNGTNNNINRNGKEKRLLSLLLCLMLLFTMNGGAVAGFVEPVQAAAAAIGSAAANGASGVRTLASDLSVRFGGMFSGFSAWLLSITPDADPDADPDTDPEPETDPHDLAEVFWNCAPDDVIDTDTNTVILKGGDDAHDGATAATPVLTWEKAVSLAAPGGKIWVMTQETVSGEAGAFILRSGNVEGLPTVLDYYAGNTSLFHVTDSVGLYLSDLDAQDDNLDPATYRRLALLDQGALRIGENAVLKGNIQIEQFMIDLESEVFVDAEAVADFASNVQLEFRFGIDPATYLTLDRDLNVVDLVEFPDGTDASAFLSNITLHPSLQDESAMSYIWKTRTKLGYPNIIQAYLAEPYDGAIYISGFGDDLNDGMYPDTPVYSYARAIAILTGTAADSAAINQWRQEHGGYQVNEGVIRIVGAPVHVGDQNQAYHTETWTMPASTYWYDENDNTVSPSWVERYKNYTGTLIEARDACVFTLRDITIKGNYADVPGAVGSILDVSQLSDVTIGAGALLTENHAENGGGVTLSGVGAKVLVNGGSITYCYASTADGMDGKGGGVFVNAGEFELRAGEISHNYAHFGGGIYETAKMVAEEPGDITIAGNVKLLGGSVTANSAIEGGGVFTTRSFVLLPASAASADIAQAVTDYGTGNICCINVTGNTARQYGGGWFAEDCTFVMDGGEISGNAVNLNMLTYAGGGGIALRGSYFLMKDGSEVSNNTVIAQSLKGPATMLGGGVYCASIPEAVLDADTGEMLKAPVDIRQGANIEYNTVECTLNYSSNLYGGGIHIGGAAGGGQQQNKLCLVNGEIFGNTLRTGRYGNMYGGGLCVNNAPVILGKFAAVERNTAYGWGVASGVGVCVIEAGISLAGGLIRYNVRTAGSFNSSYTYYATRGGGLFVDGGTFYMNAGAVMYNSLGLAGGSNHLGGGIFLNNTIAALDADSPFVSPYDSAPSVVLISQNTGFSHGGGIYLNGAGAGLVTRLLDGSDPDLTDVIIEANTVTGNGGGLYAADNATVVLRSVTFRLNAAGGGGGAAYIIKSNGLIMNDVTVEENTAAAMGGVAIAGTQTTVITKCDFTGNSATGGNCGALFFTNADFSASSTQRSVALTVTNSTFTDNTALYYGGAAYFAGAPTGQYTYTVTLQGCTFGGSDHGNGCTAYNAETGNCGRGGAVYNVGAALTVSNCDITYNGAYYGGGIYNCSGTLAVTDDTSLNYNRAFYGGGIYTETGEVRLLSCDISLCEVFHIPGGSGAGIIVPLLCEGRSVYSRQAFVYLDCRNVTVTEFYFYTRTYCLRLLYADSTFEDVVKIALNVSEGANRYVAGDHVVEPATDGTLTSVVNFENNFTLVREAADAYDLVAVSPNLVLAPRSVYIDGVHGDDSNSGSKPTDAVKTFAVARQKLVALLNANPTADKKIYIVNTVTVSGTEVWSFNGYTMPAVDEDGVPTGEMIAVYGVTMQAYIADNTLNVGGKALVLVDGGDLTFEGITLDGNRAAFPAKCANYGFKVINGGALTVQELSKVQNHRVGVWARGEGDAATGPSVTIRESVITNCDNSTNTSYTSGSDPYADTSAAGVTVNYGTLRIQTVQITNCTGRKQGGGVHLDNTNAVIDDLEVTNCVTTQSYGTSVRYEHATGQGQWEYCVHVLYTGNGGGGIYQEGGTLTLTNSNLHDIRNCNQPMGAALQVKNGVLTAVNTKFNNNGSTGTSWNGAYGGVVAVWGGANASFENCDFNSNKSLDGVLYMVYGAGTSGCPTVWVKGCNFAWNTVDNMGILCAVGTTGGAPVNLNIAASTGENGRATKIYSNDAQGMWGGAIYGCRSNINIADAEIYSNTCRGGGIQFDGESDGYQPGGGSAISMRYGRLSMVGSYIYNNTCSEGDYNNNRYFCGGTVNLVRCVSAEIRGCEISNNTFTNRYTSTSSSRTGEFYRGGGVSLFNVTSSLLEDVNFTGNVIRFGYDYAYNNSLKDNFAYGAGLGIRGGSTTVKNVTFTGNTLNAVNVSARTQRRGAAMYAENARVEMDNVSCSGNTSGGGGAVWLQSCSFIGLRTALAADDDIVLQGSATPISLLSPLTGAGEIALRYTDIFLGKHIVCGYSNLGTVDSGYHNTTADPGTLNAYDYIEENSEPHFIPAEKPLAQHLWLASGEATSEYTHDIIVLNPFDVYLDGENGLDALRDADGHITGYQTDGNGITHDGASPATAFKTFDCAKEALKTRIFGNIIICGKVTVSTDEDWELGEFTDGSSGSWYPIVKRYMNPDRNATASTRYTGVMVEVTNGALLTLTDIILSGNCRENEYPRICGSVLSAAGGDIILEQGCVIKDNNADRGGGITVSTGGRAQMTGDSKITGCTVDMNNSSTYGGEAHGYGGGVYVAGNGEFYMSSFDCEISACGPSYCDAGSNTRCYGALVCVAGGLFRVLRGRLTDAMLYKEYATATASSCKIYGAVCTVGGKYNDETGAGALAEINVPVTGNFTRYKAPSGYVTSGYPFTIYGSALASTGGTLRLQPALSVVIWNGQLLVATEGAKITQNRITDGSSYGMIYLTGGNTLLEMKGGEITDDETAAHSYSVYAESNASFVMENGLLSTARATNAVYLTGSTFTLDGGRLNGVNSNTNAMVYLNTNAVFNMKGGSIYGSSSITKGVDMSGGSCKMNMSGGEISGLRSYGVYLIASSGTLNMSGGIIRNSNYGIYLYYGNTTISGGEIHHATTGVYQNSSFSMSGGRLYACKNALDNTGGTSNLSGGRFYENTERAIYARGGTVNVTSDDVEVYNNICSSPIECSGTLNMTYGKVHDNVGSICGGVRVYGGSPKASFGPCEIYNNESTSSSGGIAIGPYSATSVTYTLSGTKIHHNKAKNEGGGLSLGAEGQGNFTVKFNCTYLKIYDNTANQGGGVYVSHRARGQQNIQTIFDNCSIYNNTASNQGGGVFINLGYWDTTTANPGRLNSQIDFAGTEIRNNSAKTSGGGIFIYRSARNDVRAAISFGTSVKPQIQSFISGNTAGVAGGAIGVTTKMTSSAFPVYSTSDITVSLNDIDVSGNVAGIDLEGNATENANGGGIYANRSKFVLNNVFVSKNFATGNGGGIYADTDSEFMLAQGSLDSNEVDGSGNGVYVGKANVEFVNNYLQTGENDDFYLAYRSNPLLMYKSFTNAARVYKVYPSEEYVAGDIVVHPTGLSTDASPYLRNFISIRPGTVLERRYPDIILGRIIFLDGETGIDPVFNGDGSITYQTDDLGVLHDGTAPDKAFATFAASKRVLGSAPGSIYVSGPVEISQDETWSLGEQQYMRRYCGFTVSADTAYPPFKGDMFTVTGGTLTLENISIQGSFNAADDFAADGSVFVLSGGNLTVNEGTFILENRSTVNGAGVRIETGEMHMTGGEISGNTYVGSGKGGGVYQGDTLTLSGDTLKITDDIYLAAGDADTADRVITVPALDFAPADASTLYILVENPADGRDIVAYPAGSEPGDAQKLIYDVTHDPDVAGQYIVDNEPARRHILELRLPYQVYLDGVNGSDLNDGKTPETSVKTVHRAYELIRDAHTLFGGEVSGGLIHVVDTVTIASAMALSQTYVSGGVTVDAEGPVSFKRYAQPTAHASIEGFERPTNVNALFNVASGGSLTLENVTVDGHAGAITTGNPALVAPGVTAEAALIVVETGGAFTLSGGRLQNASANETALAGALTLNGGTADITGGVIYNAEAAYETEETGVSVYQNGTLNLSGSPAISGGVYLAQNETYVTVPAAFSPANAVLLIPNHAFDGRDLARYDASLGVPGEPEKLHWTLPAEILLTYGVNNDADDPQMLELQLKGAVYIDGVNGNDTRDGATPETAVKTLKRAYTLLSGLDGSTLYVVDTVTISASAILDHGWYLSGTDEIDAGGDVQFIRYSQPSDYNAEEPGELTGFGKPSCTGALLEVPAGLSLAVNGVTFDGHSYAVTDSVPRYNAPGVEAAAALLLVNEGGTADLSDHTILQNNANVSEDGEGKGGAIANYGTVLMGGVTVINNSAFFGQGVYQSGTLKVNGTAHPTVAADQQIHLTGLQGAEDERLITVTGALDEGFTFTVNFDDPVLGRNVAHFEAGAFTGAVDGEKNHFVLAPGIEYTIVKSNDPAEPDTLELGKGYSLTIFKYADMTDLKEPNKTFLFEVTDVTPGAESNGNTYYVYIGTYTDAVTGETVPAWVDNAYSYVSVTGLPEGVYTVRELTDWSWRYEVTDAWGADDEHYSVSDDFVVTVELDGSRTVYFRNTLTNPDYVNGYARSYSNTFCP